MEERGRAWDGDRAWGRSSHTLLVVPHFPGAWLCFLSIMLLQMFHTQLCLIKSLVIGDEIDSQPPP